VSDLAQALAVLFEGFLAAVSELLAAIASLFA
jgi:hypothetical protein